VRKVSLKELKQDLAKHAKNASRGEVVEVSKYNKPYIKLVTAAKHGVIVGDLVGSPVKIKRALRAGSIKLSSGAIEALLSTDRNERGES